MPLVWSTNIINRARKDGLITSDHIVQTILVRLNKLFIIMDFYFLNEFYYALI